MTLCAIKRRGIHHSRISERDMTNNELLNAALEYAANGWPVLPCWWINEETGHCACSKGKECLSPGKHHIGKSAPNGAENASLDPEQLRSWWTRNPQANVAGLVGSRTGKAVLDVESVDGHGVDGKLCLRQLEEEYREMLAPTASYITGNNGRNSVFQCVADDLKPTDYSIGPGVELRFADNQYVLLPPSKTKGVYRWKLGDWRAPLKIPPWISEAAQDSKEAPATGKAGTGKRAGQLPGTAQPGARHKSVVSLLGTLRARGFTKEAAAAAALAYNSKSCDPPKPESYVIDAVDDIYARYEPRGSAPENEREYRVDEDGLYWWHYKSEYDKTAQEQIFTPIKTRLSNFDAHITKEIIRDDGSEQARSYIIEGELLPSGDALPAKEVKAEDFATMSWAYSWGVGAVVEPKPIIRDNLRAAIQTRSASTYETCRIFTHIGWRKDGDNWRYLHAGGAITADGLDSSVNVDLGESRLQYYYLPEPSAGDALKEDILKVITLCNGIPATMVFPDLGLTFRPIFNEINHAECCDYILGDTGIFKTARAAVFQAFYGPEFTPEKLPAGWESTDNALDKILWRAKDALLTIDDFKPAQSTGEATRQYNKADRVIRGSANQQGRQRLKRNSADQVTFISRGGLRSTGEIPPVGQSLRARMLVRACQRGDITKAWLDYAQNVARDGIYARMMSAFIQWAASRFDRFNIRHIEAVWRDKLAAKLREGYHARTASNLAECYTGFAIFLAFAIRAGAISAKVAKRLKGLCIVALIEVGNAQQSYIRQDDPVQQFFEMLRGALSVYGVSIKDASDGGYVKGNGEVIGWLKGDKILLIESGSPAYAAAQQFARKMGTTLLVKESDLWPRMADKGILTKETADKLRYSTVAYIPFLKDGKGENHPRQRVREIDARALLGDEFFGGQGAQ